MMMRITVHRIIFIQLLSECATQRAEDGGAPPKPPICAMQCSAKAEGVVDASCVEFTLLYLVESLESHKGIMKQRLSEDVLSKVQSRSATVRKKLARLVSKVSSKFRGRTRKAPSPRTATASFLQESKYRFNNKVAEAESASEHGADSATGTISKALRFFKRTTFQESRLAKIASFAALIANYKSSPQMTCSMIGAIMRFESEVTDLFKQCETLFDPCAVAETCASESVTHFTKEWAEMDLIIEFIENFDSQQF